MKSLHARSHSVRSATSGSTRAARRAGARQATAATTASTAGTTPNVTVSKVSTPYRKLRRRARGGQRGHEADRRAEADQAQAVVEHQPEDVRCGARRGPCGRRSRASAGDTENAMTPYTPIADEQQGEPAEARPAASRPRARGRGTRRPSLRQRTHVGQGQVGLERLYRAPHRGDQRRRVARRPRVEDHPGLVVLGQRHVGDRGGRLGEPAVLAVAHEADHLQPRPLRPGEADPVVESVALGAFGEVDARERLVDDGDRAACSRRPRAPKPRPASSRMPIVSRYEASTTFTATESARPSLSLPPSLLNRSVGAFATFDVQAASRGRRRSSDLDAGQAGRLHAGQRVHVLDHAPVERRVPARACSAAG